jgi:hypothetical protein
MVLDTRNNDVQANQRPPSGGFFVGPVLLLAGARQLILQREPTTRTIIMNGSAIRTRAWLHWNENPPTSGVSANTLTLAQSANFRFRENSRS